MRSTPSSMIWIVEGWFAGEWLPYFTGAGTKADAVKFIREVLDDGSCQEFRVVPYERSKRYNWREHILSKKSAKP